MNETQKTIGDWAKATFPGGDDLSPRHCVRLLEEVIELCLAAGSASDDLRAAMEKHCYGDGDICGIVSNPQPHKVAEELADVEIVVRVLAERRGIDLQSEVDRKMQINRNRRWAVRGDGTGYHIKDPA